MYLVSLPGASANGAGLAPFGEDRSSVRRRCDEVTLVGVPADASREIQPGRLRVIVAWKSIAKGFHDHGTLVKFMTGEVGVVDPLAGEVKARKASASGVDASDGKSHDGGNGRGLHVGRVLLT